MERVKDERIFRRQRYPLEVFYSVLPPNLTKDGFELCRRIEGLFPLLAFPLDILAMCTFVSLNVLETTFAVSHGIELRS
jgi:hypothetical protein